MVLSQLSAILTIRTLCQKIICPIRIASGEFQGSLLTSCSAQKQKEASLGEVRSWLLSPDLSSPLLGSPALKPDADDKNENRLPDAIDSSSRTSKALVPIASVEDDYLDSFYLLTTSSVN
ncbi:hypothetical protein HZH68_014181 [Vespula germanica]|uniref:Uncharacterized protein n=1 Tax=Vespula germanica TaxID=30212 RepID=A0A834JCI9_VESGE|nr:hypothetical protein HZH68_014181 [Vespula germanica]